MNAAQSALSSLVDKHALKAGESEYDRGVAVAAIAAARKTILAVPIGTDVSAYHAGVRAALERLHARYHDPDGQYTSGKGVIGSLIDDLPVA